MLLSGVLFVLFLAGCWLYCLTDAALTPAREFRGLSKSAWISIIAVTFVVGATAWLVTRRSRAGRSPANTNTQPGGLTLIGSDDTDFASYAHWTASDDAIARHPAGRSRKAPTDGWIMPKGPDDDPEFLRELAHRIHGTSADTGE
jgi:hypothetical protein